MLENSLYFWMDKPFLLLGFEQMNDLVKVNREKIEISGQSYKQFTPVIYGSRVVIWGTFQVRYDFRIVNYNQRGFIRLPQVRGVR